MLTFSPPQRRISAQVPAGPFGEICKRAGGRRHYNRKRQDTAIIRRYRVLDLLAQGKTQREIAGELHVHEATISRDAAFLQGSGGDGGLVDLVRAAAGQGAKVKITRRGWSFKLR